MSIDTLLEAARYLEWQAQQQQITREEEEEEEEEERARENAVFVPAPEQKQVALPVPLVPQRPLLLNHVTWAEETRAEPQRPHPSPAPALAPPPALPPHVPIAVIPIPVVTAPPPLQAHAATVPVVTPLAPAPSLIAPAGKDAHSPPLQQHRPLVKAEAAVPPPSGNSPKPQQQSQQPLLQPAYPLVAVAPQHALLAPHSAPPTLQNQAPPSRLNGAAPEDARNLEGKRRPGGAGTREVHNKLEKNRRAHLKECFETLKRNVPNVDEKKTSNLSVLRSALRYIQTLKRKEKEYEHEMERLAREKISTQQRLAELKNELSQCMDVVEIDRILRQTFQPDDDQASTSTASEGEDNFEQDGDDEHLVFTPCSSSSSTSSTSASLRPPLPSSSAPAPPEPRPPVMAPPPVVLPAHVSLLQPKPSPPPSAPPSQPPQAIAPAPPPQQPTVIAHASVSHASVIQAVNHVLPTAKQLAHIAPSGGAPHPHIGHITVHPVAALYPQHIAHTLAQHPQGHVHPQVTAATVATTVVGKPATAVVAHHHAGLVGQTVLNPVTMVTVPPFPVSTLKLA